MIFFVLFCVVPKMSNFCTFLTDYHLPNVPKCKWIMTFNFWPSAAFIFPQLPLGNAKITETGSWFPVWVFIHHTYFIVLQEQYTLISDLMFSQCCLYVLKSQVFWDAMLCWLVVSYQHCKGSQCLQNLSNCLPVDMA